MRKLGSSDTDFVFSFPLVNPFFSKIWYSRFASLRYHLGIIDKYYVGYSLIPLQLPAVCKREDVVVVRKLFHVMQIGVSMVCTCIERKIDRGRGRESYWMSSIVRRYHTLIRRTWKCVLSIRTTFGRLQHLIRETTCCFFFLHFLHLSSFFQLLADIICNIKIFDRYKLFGAKYHVCWLAFNKNRKKIIYNTLVSKNLRRTLRT